MTSGWDHVVVGAGSAGCVVAGRLAEVPGRRVLLLEAGGGRVPVRRPVGEPTLSGANWPYVATVDGRRVPYPVGRVLGGSSAVNSGIALRARPADVAGWAVAGGPEWSWEHVLPCMRRVERRLAVHTTPPSGPAAEAFLVAAKDAGLPEVADLNGDTEVGVGPVPGNQRAGTLVTAADAYVARARSLVVRTGCRVLRVLCVRGRAVGVEVVVGSRVTRIAAGHVVLCAGGVNTPVLLERTGIGAADRLTRLGIEVVADRPGVGENLADHPAVVVWALPAVDVSAGSGPRHAVMARTAVTGLFLATDVTGAGLPTLEGALGGRSALSLSAVLFDPEARGHVHLTDTGQPEIALPFSASERDIGRLMAGTRAMWSLLQHPALAGLVARTLLWTDRLVADDALLASAVRRFAVPLWHPCGTARLGPATDPLSVVDGRCRVHGLAGLSIVDASILPSIPRATPNLACLTIAERAAEWLA